MMFGHVTTVGGRGRDVGRTERWSQTREPPSPLPWTLRRWRCQGCWREVYSRSARTNSPGLVPPWVYRPCKWSRKGSGLGVAWGHLWVSQRGRRGTEWSGVSGPEYPRVVTEGTGVLFPTVDQGSGVIIARSWLKSRKGSGQREGGLRESVTPPLLLRVGGLGPAESTVEGPVP